MSLGDLSLVSDDFVDTLAVLAIGSMIASVGWRARRTTQHPHHSGVHEARSGRHADAVTTADAGTTADARTAADAGNAAGSAGGIGGGVATATVVETDEFHVQVPAWRLQLLVGVPITAALVGITALLVDGLALIPYQFPNSYYFWFGLLVLALVMCPLGWTKLPGWQRIMSLLSIVLTSMLVFALVNQEFTYYPTLAGLLGQDAAFDSNIAELHQAQAQYKQTHQLPDHGFTLSVAIPGRTSGFNAREATVWIPPAWVASPTPKLPVIELIQGAPGSPADWTRAADADQTARAFAESHQGVAPILVMPDPNGAWGNDTECVNSSLGNVETYLTVDVPAFIQKTFHTQTSPQSTAIGGFSMGGMCALMLSIRHPDVFQTFADYAGLQSPTVGESVEIPNTVQQLFGGSMTSYDAHNPPNILSTQKFPGMSGWFEVGQQDAGPLAAQTLVVPLAKLAGINVCAQEIPGEHSWSFAMQAFQNSFAWLVAHVGLTTTPPADGSCPS